jgi:hypothetical protein
LKKSIILPIIPPFSAKEIILYFVVFFKNELKKDVDFKRLTGVKTTKGKNFVNYAQKSVDNTVWVNIGFTNFTLAKDEKIW